MSYEKPFKVDLNYSIPKEKRLKISGAIVIINDNLISEMLQ